MFLNKWTIWLFFAFGQFFNHVSAGEVMTFRGHKNPIWALAFSPDGRKLLSGGGYEGIKIWEINTGKSIDSFSVPDGVFFLAFSPNGKWLAAGMQGVKLWDFALKKVHFTLHKQTDFMCRGAAFAPSGKEFATGEGKSTKLWDVETGKELRNFKDHPGGVGVVAFSPNGEVLAVGDGSGAVTIWKRTTGEKLATFQGSEEVVKSLSFSPDGKTLAVGAWDCVVRVWDLKSGKQRLNLAHQDIAMAVAFSPDGKYLATGSAEKKVRLWDVGNGIEKACLQYSSIVLTVAFSPDGHWLAAAGGDIIDNKDPCEVKIWELKELIKSK